MEKVTLVQKISFFNEIEWSDTIIFLLMILVLVIANLPSVNTTLYENGDLAANGLLIQNAKSLHLLVGNYSRIGFNHPGPAILYVLAFGELIFYDWLHLVKSPFAGQVIAAAFYNAFWITLIFKHIRRITCSIISSVLTISVFLLATVYLDQGFFTSLWFPHLYFFPFAAFLVSISRLVYGKTDSLLTVALSAGFLMNGHVCFIPLTGIIFFIITIFNYCISRKTPICPCLLSKDFLHANKKSIIAFFIVLFLFFVPLLLQTIFHFPGPVPHYIRFSGQHKAHTILEEVRFVSSYWTGGMFFLVGIIVSLAIYFFSQFLFNKSTEDIRSMLIVFFAATFSAFFYANYGIDYLNMKYIELFYEAVPAFLVALICLFAYQILNFFRKKELALVVAGLCFIVLFMKIYHHPFIPGVPSHLDIPETYQTLKATKSKGRLVLDLDYTYDWEIIWGNIVGIELYTKRNKMDELFCINKNWHILFTKSAHCSTNEVLTGKRFFVTDAVANNKSKELPAIKGMGLEFYEYSFPDLSNRKYFTVSEVPVLFKEYFLQSGWSNLEEDFFWSYGNESHLSFRLKPGFSGTILLDVQGYLPSPDSNKLLSVYVNNIFTGNFEFTTQNNRKKVAIPIKNLKSGILDIKLVVDKVVSPSDLGLSADTRKLGIALYGLQVK